MFLRDNLPGFDGSGGGRMRASYVGSNTAVRSTHYSVADGALGFAIADGRMRPPLRGLGALGFAVAWTAEAAVAT